VRRSQRSQGPRRHRLTSSPADTRESRRGYSAPMTTSTDSVPPEIYLVLDAVDVDVVAGFWAAALRYQRVDRVEQYAILLPLDGHQGPMFLVQGVPEGKTV